MQEIKSDSEESFNIIEIGSDKTTLEEADNYLTCSQNIYCINPNKKDLDNLEFFYKKKNKVNFKKLNFAVSDVSGKKTFYVTKDDSASSIYEPNHEILRRYRTDNIFDVVDKKEVQCENLDNVCLKENINNIDLLLLFCQASELNILKGSGKILEKISVIHTDASFVEKYKKQPLFSDIVSYLNKNEFKFVGYTHSRVINGKIIEVRALFINKKLEKKNSIINVAKILIFYNFYWEAKWLLLDNKLEKKIYTNLVSIKIKKNIKIIKILFFLYRHFKIILFLFAPLRPLIAKTRIAKEFLIFLDANKKNQ